MHQAVVNGVFYFGAYDKFRMCNQLSHRSQTIRYPLGGGGVSKNVVAKILCISLLDIRKTVFIDGLSFFFFFKVKSDLFFYPCYSLLVLNKEQDTLHRVQYDKKKTAPKK